MKKYLIIIALLLNGISNAQDFKFAVIKNLNELRASGSVSPDSLNKIISSGGFDSFVSTGNLTNRGTLTELDTAKKYLDSTKLTYSVLGGINEFSAGYPSMLNMDKFFEDDSFVKTAGDYLLIGVQSISLADCRRAHISLETLARLKSSLAGAGGKKIILLLNAETDAIDNFSSLKDLLAPYQVGLVITPEYFPKTVKTIIAGRRKRSVRINHYAPFIYGIELRNDSLFTYLYSGGNGFQASEGDVFEPVNMERLAGKGNGQETITSLIPSTVSSYSGLLPYKNNLIISSADGSVVSYNPDFSAKWKYRMSNSIASSPIISDSTLILASAGGDVILLDPVKRIEQQSIGIDCEITSELEIIHYKGDKELLIPKSTKSDKALLFGSAEGDIFCYDLETMQEYWNNSDSKSAPVKNIIDTGTMIVFKNGEGKIICIDSRSGQLIWRWGNKDTYADVATCLYFNGKQIISVTNKGTLVGIDFLLGVAEWQFDKNDVKDIYIAPENDKIILALGEGKLYQVNSNSGKLIRETRFRDKGIDSFITDINADPQLWLLSSGNQLYRLEKNYTLKKYAYAGPAPVVSIYPGSEGGIFILNSDGQLFKTEDAKK